MASPTSTAESTPPPTDPRPRGCSFSRSDWETLASLWHPVAYASEVPAGKPVSLRLLDERLVAYRTSKGVTVAKDLCIHRGAEISRGWIEGDEIVCGYHGFRYNPEGQCTRVPAQPNLPVPKKLCLKVFPAVERYGLIWTCLSGQPKAPLPEWPTFEDPKFRRVQHEPLVWQTSASRHVENFNDVAHLSWVHAASFGNRDRPEIEPYEVEETAGVLHFRCPYHGKFLEEGSGVRSDRTQTILYDYRLTLPFSTQLIVEFPDARRHYMWDIATPVSLKVTKIFFQSGMNFNHDVPVADLLADGHRVLGEDQAMVESQHPEELPLDLSEEFHIRADRQSTHYRQALRRLGLGRDMAS